MIRYKIDVMEALKKAGYSTYRIRKEKILAESTMQKLREGVPVSTDNLDTLCRLLGIQPGDLFEYVEEGVTND